MVSKKRQKLRLPAERQQREGGYANHFTKFIPRTLGSGLEHVNPIHNRGRGGTRDYLYLWENAASCTAGQRKSSRKKGIRNLHVQNTRRVGQKKGRWGLGKTPGRLPRGKNQHGGKSLIKSLVRKIPVLCPGQNQKKIDRRPKGREKES